MARILVIEKNPRTHAFLQCRLSPGTKVKSAASMECAWEKLASAQIRFDSLERVSGHRRRAIFPETLKVLADRIGDTKAIVLTDSQHVRSPSMHVPDRSAKTSNR